MSPIVPKLERPTLPRPDGSVAAIPVFVPVTLGELANSRESGADAVVMMHRLRHQLGRYPWTSPPLPRFQRRPYDYGPREPMVWSGPS
ncbi:MAG TPA: hypothetical protein VGK43_02660 [Solirubrobacterales bacterium]